MVTDVAALCAPLLKSLQSSWWTDVSKTLIGTFTGAFLAFLSNLVIQRCNQRRENIAAGNLALTTLCHQWNDFLVLKKGILATRAQIIAAYPKAPEWACFKPAYYYFSDSRKFDFKSLSFLFKSNPSIFNDLALAEQRYYDLAHVVQQLAEAAEARQKKMDELGFIQGQDFTFNALEDRLGPALIGRLSSLAQDILVRLEEYEETYKGAAEALNGQLFRLFGEKEISYIRTLKPEEKK